MSHYSKCVVIKVHFSHFVCVSGVAFLRLTGMRRFTQKVSVYILNHAMFFTAFAVSGKVGIP